MQKTKQVTLARRPNADQRTALRARIVLACAEGLSNQAVAARLQVSAQTVGILRERFRKGGLNALGDLPRPGQPRQITDAKLEALVTRTLETRLKKATHWSTRTMAEASGLAQSAIVRIWRALGLKPHLQENFKLSTDPFFVEKVRDIVGLYVHPQNVPASSCFAWTRRARCRPSTVANQYCLCDLGRPSARPTITTVMGPPPCLPRSMWPLARCWAAAMPNIGSRSSCAFWPFEANVPSGLEIHLVLDNDATHKTPKVAAWLKKRPLYHLHFTPTSSSWLNQVKRWFAKITQERIRRGVFKSVDALIAAIDAYIAQHNRNPKSFVWTASADLILRPG